MSYYSELSPQERLKKVSKLLLRGMYLHAKEKGWIKKQQSSSAKKIKKSKTSIELHIPDGKTDVSTKEIYTVAETAKILGITTRTLQRWIQTGKIKTIREENGYHVISQDEVNYQMVLIRD